MRKLIPEFNYLLTEVEKHYGRAITTTTDFEALSVVIEHEINELVSASTLKRLWGYVSSNPVPRMSTLDILSRYVGEKDFKSFCINLKHSPAYESRFFSSDCIYSSDLDKGTVLRIGWNPNRLVRIEYQGDYLFKVLESENSQLKSGDEFEVTGFSLGYSLYIPRILRNGEYTPPYVAGSNNGLTMLQKEG